MSSSTSQTQKRDLQPAVELILKSGLFDRDYYLSRYPQALFDAPSPIAHYLVIGAKRNYDPSPDFSTRGYREAFQNSENDKMNPLVHFIKYGRKAGYNPPKADTGFPIDPTKHPHWRDYYAIRRKLERNRPPVKVDRNDVRLIALYLPQFHPIPENDEWWGEGFTEWTNVRAARKFFPGHNQPRTPANLGFYDLRDESVMEKQADLAKRYGIHGFCYHYYWFNGRRLLEMPIERMLETGKPDMPFCLCWANENWTRRWDGREKDILMPQDHTPEDDEAAIRDLTRFFADDRYIRVDGRPVLVIYRFDLFPDIKATAARWRKVCKELGVGDPYLVYAETFGLKIERTPPESIGFDAAMEYPPHNSPTERSGELPESFAKFDGIVFDYIAVALHNIRRPWTDKKLLKAVMPSWDNTPRRGDAGHVYFGASPGGYQAWLEAAIRQTARNKNKEEQLVFINAWNEWAETAYLEPDEQYGYAYLEATRNALAGKEPLSTA